MSARQKKAAKAKKTPVRSSLKQKSLLNDKVCDGIQALETPHRGYLATEIQGDFADSLDLDKAMVEGHEQENRWDYLLGHAPSDTVVGLEPHSAKQDEIGTVINKKKAARVQLRDHLKQGKGIARWLWVASGKVHFADTEKARRRLDQNGIQFAGKKVLTKHLQDLKA